MSANLIVDLGNAAHCAPSLPGGIVVSPSGYVAGLSGQLVGNAVYFRGASINTNVYVAGTSVTSGPLRVGVQTSPDGVSGTFTDPTSGMPQMPSWFSSGGWLIIGQSGSTPGTRNAGNGVSGQFLLSGFCEVAHFQNPHPYARLILGSGFYDGPIQAGFIAQKAITGSGGGYDPAPQTGSVNV